MNQQPTSLDPEQEKKVRRWSVAFGVLLCVTAVVVLSIGLGTALRTTTRGLHQMTLPGTTALPLRKAGMYIGFVEQKPDADYTPNDVNRLQINLVGPSGRPVPLVQNPGLQIQMLGDRRGLVLFQAEVQETGNHQLQSAYPNRVGPQLPLFLVHESLGHNRQDIVVGFILFLVLGGFGVFILVKSLKKPVSPPPAAPNNKKKRRY